MADETKPKQIIQVSDLSQLGSQKINIEIEDGDTLLVIPAHTLTHAEWYQCERDVPRPMPPDFAGRDGIKYNTEDPAYKQRLAEYWDNVAYLRVVRALDITIDGATEADKVANLSKSIGVQAMNAITRGLTIAHAGREARVANRAETFQPNGTSHSSDNGQTGATADVVLAAE